MNVKYKNSANMKVVEVLLLVFEREIDAYRSQASFSSALITCSRSHTPPNTRRS